LLLKAPCGLYATLGDFSKNCGFAFLFVNPGPPTPDLNCLSTGFWWGFEETICHFPPAEEVSGKQFAPLGLGVF
jgi:hypothetical protein